MPRIAHRTLPALIAIPAIAIVAWSLRFSDQASDRAALISIPDTQHDGDGLAGAAVGGANPGVPPVLAGPPALRARISGERRDPSWSPQAERALDAYFNGTVKAAGEKARVYCAQATCVVMGSISGSTSPGVLRSSMQAVQDKASNAVSSWMGFSPGATVSFSTGHSEDGRITFTTYILRSDRK